MLLEAFLNEKFLHRDGQQSLVGVVVLHSLLELVQENMMQHVDFSDVTKKHPM
jgi:hypothetical protein